MITFICDIDGTLSNLTEKQIQFLKSKEPGTPSISKLSWAKDYYSECINQKPIVDGIVIAWNFLLQYPKVHFYFSTSRSEIIRRDTRVWLKDSLIAFDFTGEQTDNIAQIIEENLLMRGADDFRPSFDVKAENLQKIKRQSIGMPFIAFEDDALCQEMYRKNGCYVLDSSITRSVM